MWKNQTQISYGILRGKTDKIIDKNETCASEVIRLWCGKVLARIEISPKIEISKSSDCIIYESINDFAEVYEIGDKDNARILDKDDRNVMSMWIVLFYTLWDCARVSP